MYNQKPTSKIELRFSCKKLKDLDVLSKSDPRVSVFLKDIATGSYNIVGRTETIQNNLNPIFQTPVQVDFRFEEVQHLRIDVHDVDKNDEDFIGSVGCTLTSILSKAGQTSTMELKTKDGKKAGTITIVAEEIKNSLQTLKFTLVGSKFDKKDLIGKSDPFFILSKRSPNGEFIKIYESQVQKNTLNPVFSGFSMKLDEFCNSDLNREMKFEFFDWDRFGKNDVIGEFITTTNDLLKPNQTYNVINHHKKQKKSDYKNSGTVQVVDCIIEREYQFLEYIVGGCQINLIVGIDCTASNGAPNMSSSLHYKHPTIPNQYANAIVSIGNVLMPYSSSPLVPTYGFGGIVPGQDQVSHCFPMSLDPNNCLCNGVGGILDCYYQNIGKVQLHGPTYFAPLINMAARYASQGQSQSNQKYTLLLILTDGEILDVENTIDAIVKASHLPLSIIIVGVGNADFTNMNMLDGDDAVLQSGGMKAERDIVQFVPMRDFINKPFELLAAEVLREVPTQFLSFAKKYKFRPNPPQPVPQQSTPVLVGTSPQAPPSTQQPTTAINLDKNGSSSSTTVNLDKQSPPTTVNLDKQSPQTTVNLEKN